MTFKILGTGMGPLILSPKDRKIGVPDLEVLFNSDLYSDRSDIKAVMEDVLDTLLDKEKMMPRLKKCAEEKKNKTPLCFDIQSVLSNRKKNAFTVVWADGTTTVVHCQSGDDWDDEKALAMCFTKKALGNKGNFNDKFNDALDNKMKVIPAEKAPEKACDCDGTCEECTCKAEAEKFIEEIEALKKKKNAFGLNKQTADELTKATIKANNSLKEMIDALTGETNKAEGEPEPAHTYKIYMKIGGESLFDSNKYSIESLRERVHEIATELYGGRPYYYRTWMNGDRMIIDFGHYTRFIEVEGITPDEYAKN